CSRAFLDLHSFPTRRSSDLDGSGHHPSNIRTGSLREKILPPIIKNDTPWIGNGKLSSPFQMFSCRIISIKTPVGPTHRAIGRLYVSMQKHTLGHIDST